MLACHWRKGDSSERSPSKNSSAHKVLSELKWSQGENRELAPPLVPTRVLQPPSWGLWGGVPTPTMLPSSPFLCFRVKCVCEENTLLLQPDPGPNSEYALCQLNSGWQKCTVMFLLFVIYYPLMAAMFLLSSNDSFAKCVRGDDIIALSDIAVTIIQ